MQYLYTFKTRYDVVHVDLGPVFMVSRLHLGMLWAELVERCAAQGCRQAIVERGGRFQDLRASIADTRGDLLCGIEVGDLRVAFCLYDEACEDHLAEFAAVAAPLGSTLRRFGAIAEAIDWVAAAAREERAQSAGVVPLAEGQRAAQDERDARARLEHATDATDDARSASV